VTIVHGLVIAVAAMAATFVVVALAGLALVAIQIQEERHGTGCRAAMVRWVRNSRR